MNIKEVIRDVRIACGATPFLARKETIITNWLYYLYDEVFYPDAKHGRKLISVTVNYLIGRPTRDYVCRVIETFARLRDSKPVIYTPIISSLHSKLEALHCANKDASLVYVLYGEPGTGKTYIAHALASLLTIHGFSLVEQAVETVTPLTNNPRRNDVEIDEEYSGPDAAMNKGTTKEVILVDEFDRGLTDKDLGEVLRWIDKKRREPGVRVILLTTNKTPADLDVALLRKGRVTDCVEVLPWTEMEAKEFCKQKEVPFSYIENKEGKYYPGALLELTQEYWINKIEAEVRERGHGQSTDE